MRRPCIVRRDLPRTRMMVDLDTRSLTTGKDLYYVAISREAIKTAALDIQRGREVPQPARTV